MKIAFLFALLTAGIAEAKECAHPWIYFDTGETLISVPPDYRNMQNKAGMEGYLQSLRDAGYPLGLIVNIPEDWGSGIEGKNLLTRRVIYLQQFLAEGWLPGAPPFPMGFFGHIRGKGPNRQFQGRVFFPEHNSDRKPKTCPTCALNVAASAAKRAGCPAVYAGEDAKEMEAAESVGLIPFQVGQTDPESFFLPVEKIPEYVRTYTPGRWKTPGGGN